MNYKTILISNLILTLLLLSIARLKSQTNYYYFQQVIEEISNYEILTLNAFNELQELIQSKFYSDEDCSAFLLIIEKYINRINKYIELLQRDDNSLLQNEIEIYYRCKILYLFSLFEYNMKKNKTIVNILKDYKNILKKIRMMNYFNSIFITPFKDKIKYHNRKCMTLFELERKISNHYKINLRNYQVRGSINE
jgi:hypothetical protein